MPQAATTFECIFQNSRTNLIPEGYFLKSTSRKGTKGQESKREEAKEDVLVHGRVCAHVHTAFSYPFMDTEVDSMFFHMSTVPQYMWTCGDLMLISSPSGVRPELGQLDQAADSVLV